MADSKLTALTAEATPVGADLLYLVDDVAGTPTSKKATLTDLAGSAPFSGAYAPLAGPYMKDYARATRTAGDITLNATAVTAVNTGLDLVLTAAAGDLIIYSPSLLLSAAAGAKGFDVYTMVAGSPVNPFGPGLSASLGTIAGVPSWRASATAVEFMINGGFPRTLVAGDIESGTVTLRLYYAGLNATARTLFAQTSYPCDVWAVNMGPA